jgi:hypothetical protein
MIVRVKKIMGTYGLVKNGRVVPMTYSSGAFEVTEEKGRELVARGIVDVVGAAQAPATAAAAAPAPAPVPEPEQAEEPEEMTLNELRKIARKRGMKGYGSLSKKELIRELEKAEEEADSPTFDAAGGVA